MKKILATATAVVLSLAMVAMPAVAMADELESTETVTTETVTTETTESTETTETTESTEPTEPTEPTETVEPAATQRVNSNSNSNSNNNNENKDDDTPKTCDQAGYTKFDSSSGSETLMSGSTVIGTLVWTGTSLTYTLNAGWTIDICIKSGSQVGLKEYDDVSGTGTLTIVQDISHIGWADPKFTEQPTEVTPDATFVDEVCVDDETLVPGVITVDLSVVGVTYSITQGGNPVAFDAGTGKTGPLTAGLTYIVTASANPGYVLSGPYQEQFAPTDKSEDCGDVSSTVTPDATFVDEVCNEVEGKVVPGIITVDLTVVGVTYSITQGGNPVAFDAVTGKTGDLEAGKTYIVTATANPGYTIAGGSYEEQFTPFGAGVDCEVLPGVTPLASQDPGCELPSSFTIGNTLNDPAALTWTANGDPIAEGKHIVSGPVTIKLVAAANGPDYGLEGDPQTEWTFTFPADETCGELTTLALTGSADTTPALALTAFLGLLGLAMVRSGIRVNRIRQEA